MSIAKTANQRMKEGINLTPRPKPGGHYEHMQKLTGLIR